MTGWEIVVMVIAVVVIMGFFAYVGPHLPKLIDKLIDRFSNATIKIRGVPLEVSLDQQTNTSQKELPDRRPEERRKIEQPEQPGRPKDDKSA